MLTRKVDNLDSRASFVSDWLLALAKNLDHLTVICQEKGDLTGLPDNIDIHSLGKELGHSKIRQFFRAQKLLFQLVKNCDGVFAHQMPIYGILAGPWRRLFHKKLVQWYAHGAVDWRLKLSNFFVTEFVTSSADGFRMKTKKPVAIIGQGININKFKGQRAKGKSKDGYNIISIGRISPSKDYESMIKAIYELQEQGMDNLKLIIIGAPAMAEGFAYSQNLQTMVESMNLKQQVEFIGGLPQAEIIPRLVEADLFLNLSDTGSLDKTVLEAMATGCLVLTSNIAYKNILPGELFTAKDNPELLAERIKKIINLAPERKEELSQRLRQEVVENHNLENFARKIVQLFSGK